MAKKKVTDGKVLKGRSKTLRELAEEKVLVKNGNLKDLDSEKVMQVMQELQTHQIELEMQNEELKQSHLDLEESREKYSDLYNFAPVGYITLNEKGVITMSNITSNQLLGIEKPKLTNTPFTDYIFKEDQDVYYLRRKHLVETKEKQQFEIRLVKSDKTFFWANVDAVLSVKKDGDVLITLTDVSKRKKDEDDKQNILALSEATLESVHNGILAVGNNENIIKTNEEFVKMWNVPKDIIGSGDDSKLLNYVLEQLIEPDEFIKKVKELYANPQTESFDLIYFKDGRVYERISKPMHIDGRAVGRVWSFFDISKRKQREEEIKHKNEELIKINAEKDKFFSIIAHDLRSPFNVFLGFTEMLKEDIHNLSLKELQNIANSMNRSANNLFELLTNLLEWSMIKRNDYAFHPVKLSLKKIINESLDLYAETREKKAIELKTEISDDIFITADESMLKTIMRNLISNALKFTNKGGLVTVSTNISDDVAAISVKDTGIGMPETLINDLFNIDVRTNRNGTDNERSTGLGLLLCKEFIEIHKGKISIKSEEGKGSEITVSLPLIR
jgi:PAS domain S-box-containing protein